MKNGRHGQCSLLKGVHPRIGAKAMVLLCLRCASLALAEASLGKGGTMFGQERE